jgi:hypothetical protein
MAAVASKPLSYEQIIKTLKKQHSTGVKRIFTINKDSKGEVIHITVSIDFKVDSFKEHVEKSKLKCKPYVKKNKKRIQLNLF